MLIAGTPEFILFTLVLMRISGFILFNPYFGRRDIPNLAKGGIIIVLSLITFQTAAGDIPEINSSVMYGVLLVKEFLVGFVLGFLMIIYDVVLTYCGAVIDYQMGLAMATVYDPQNGAQISLTGKILQIYFALMFFAVDGHLALMQIIVRSSDVVPYAAVAFGNDAVSAVLEIFARCFGLAIKLAFPIVMVEFISEVAVGILMKMIPQINLFILSIQLKIVIGIVLLLLFVTPIGDFISDIIDEYINSTANMLKLLT